ncbi:MAG: DUF1700 domain-containing protein [Ruminococcaceae bacterium]|nr:DUF1700 domain-containing protein [Oscillospiraceae bacterium]
MQMNKQAFLGVLRKGLTFLHDDEVEERLSFYREMIDDRVEDGLTEEEAIREIGTPEEILARILVDMPPAKAEKKKSAPKRRLHWWEILLLILGSPIWLSLLLAAFAVVLSLYAVLWSVIISLWAAEIALWGASFGVFVGGVGLAILGHMLPGLALLGAGMVCAGLSVFLFFGCFAAAKGTLLLTRKLAAGIKNFFEKGE